MPKATRKDRSDSTRAQIARAQEPDRTTEAIPWQSVPLSEHFGPVAQDTFIQIWRTVPGMNTFEVGIASQISLATEAQDSLYRSAPTNDDGVAEPNLAALDRLQNRLLGLWRSFRARSDKARRFDPITTSAPVANIRPAPVDWLADALANPADEEPYE
ncbi:hypothetical protein [Aliiruegeria lutimaris]|uniref:Uncharacterized protein n=1 Tax=Aliiruegeria lutimaris TaxID=571298 RepID=A0A1G9ES27_9RHOB|nr:hypothetical protein [Aliiruegeria lutimaris]SDK78894.1 hypothetical protein SAMN04488026_105410 [Aliiruegeria lutimaris]